MSQESGPQSNGYASLEALEQDHIATRFKDVTIEGKKFELRSLTTEEMVRVVSDIQRHPRSQNQRLIIAVVNRPKFEREAIERLSKIDAAFTAQLAKACMDHAGIDAIDSVETHEKN